MGKLNQVIAVVAGKKTNAAKALTETYHLVQKPVLFDGIIRTYRPKEDGGEQLPSESKSMQLKVEQLIDSAVKVLTEMYDAVATVDYANCSAKADVIVDGKTILKDVPPTHLLFLEKQLNDVAAFISKLPTLDPAETWNYDQNKACYATPPAETTRTKKVPKAFVKAAATKEHPAQVEVFNEDVVAGYWSTVKFSGAVPAQLKHDYHEKCRVLHEAVVKAREEANSMAISDKSVAKPVFEFIFGK